MEGAILSAGGSNFQSQLKNVTSALCTRTLPKQRRCESVMSSARQHHTYPRVSLPKRAGISCGVEACDLQQSTSPPTPDADLPSHIGLLQIPPLPNGGIKIKGNLNREAGNAWKLRVGDQHDAAPPNCVQSLFNDIELYPTKTQVFEMLVCARQCAKRKSLKLTFGEFCVFAAELRRCSRQARQSPTKTESPQWPTDKDATCKHMNGSEASPSPCEVFLGGSCNPTIWRAKTAIPYFNEMGITYFNPQVDDWSMDLVEVEHKAKAAARVLLFVLDSETRAVAASVEAAHLAAAPRDLLLVFRPYTRHQTIGRETMSEHEYMELSRARATLQEAVERRGLPAFTDIPAALRCANAVLRGGGARTLPHHQLGQTILRLKRAFDAGGGRASRITRAQALDALKHFTQASADTVQRCLPPNVDQVDFETFCTAVAEIAADGGVVEAGESGARGVATRVRRALRSLRDRLLSHSAAAAAATAESDRGSGGEPSESAATPDAAERVGEPVPARHNGLNTGNQRLKAYGQKLKLDIPQSGSSEARTAGVLTPGTERRLQRLPSMLTAQPPPPAHDVYLAGCFPSDGPRPEELLRREGLTFVYQRANDYTRMFSTPSRRSAPEHPESPRTDKKPRPSFDSAPSETNTRLEADEEVELRDKTTSVDLDQRLSASDFYTVNEDVTPQPFKGTFDEELLLSCRVLVFAMCAESAAFSTLVLAAHYAGLQPKRVVLLLQPMKPHSLFSAAAIKDYNRGRHYLADLARRAGVPVYDNTGEAVTAAVGLARASQT